MSPINYRNSVSVKQIGIWFFLCCLLVFLLKNPLPALQAAGNGLRLCGNTIIPTLFPFLVLSNLLISSGFSRFLGHIFCKPIQFLFGISENGVCAVLLGAIAGFPIGARCAVTLYEQKQCSKEETERLLAFCNNTGPAFLIGSVGIGLWNTYAIGVILYFSQLLAALVIGVALRIPKRKQVLSTGTILPPAAFRFGMIPDAITSAASHMLSICGFVLFFSVFCAMLATVPISNFLPFLYGFFEISSGVHFTAQFFQNGTHFFFGLVLTAWMVGWSGLSVHLQVLSFTASTDLSLKKYFLWKSVQGVLTALFTVGFYFFL